MQHEKIRNLMNYNNIYYSYYILKNMWNGGDCFVEPDRFYISYM